MDFQILLLTYNNQNILRHTLDNLAIIYDRHPCFEVVALDNGSSDLTLSILSSYSFVKPFRIDKNAFFSGGANTLLSMATSKFLFFMTSDTYPTYDVFKNTLSCVSLDSDIGIIGYPSQLLSGESETIIKPVLSPADLHVRHGLSGVRLRRSEARSNEYRSQVKTDGKLLVSDSKNPFVVQDSFLFINGTIPNLEKLFNRRLKLYYTEDQLCRDIHKLGYKVAYLPGQSIGHISQATCDQRLYLYSKAYVDDAIVYLLINYGLFRAALLAVDAYACLALRVLKSTITTFFERHAHKRS